MSRSKKNVAIVYAKDPLETITSMDMIRWHALTKHLSELSCNVDMVTISGTIKKKLSDRVRVIPITQVQWDRYDVIKSNYQSTIVHVPKHDFIISRLARVAGPENTARDKLQHYDLLQYQEIIANVAKVILVNDEANRQRWLRYYGNSQKVYLLPTGCPSNVGRPLKLEKLHEKFAGSIDKGIPVVLFAGTLSSRRIIKMLSEIGKFLHKNGITLVVIGSNRTAYYCGKRIDLDKKTCKYIKSVPVNNSLSYMFYADVGIAIAPGPFEFENETSKLYYYLRMGLPVVCEDKISNKDLIINSNYGRIFPYSESRKAANSIIDILGDKKLPLRKKYVMTKIAREHSWQKRAKIFYDIINRNIHPNE